MTYALEQNAVLTDPPMPVSNSPILSSPYSADPKSRSSVRRARKMFSKALAIEQGVTSVMDAMKASSPTHSSQEATYRAWTVKHPSAMSIFKKPVNVLEGKQIVVFLDYDGTLSPIVDDPDRAFMSEKMRETVREVAKHFPTAIVSGRCRDKVYDFVQLAELYYAGSHGMDIMAPARTSRGSKANGTRTTDKMGNDVVLYQPASEFLPMINQVFAALVEKTQKINGALVENNKFCVSVHYRCVEQKSWDVLADQVASVVKEFPQLRLTFGRKVFEVRPTIKWDKGKALEFLLESLGLANRRDVLPLYIGDDRTDEDAFKVLRNKGQGYGILVTTVPKDTQATYSLKEPSEVMKFLHNLVKWKRHNRLSKV